jgi:hypothetical protein
MEQRISSFEVGFLRRPNFHGRLHRYCEIFLKVMKQFPVASDPHVKITVAGPAITTSLITSGGLVGSKIAAVRTVVMPVCPSGMTFTAPRWFPPIWVKFRITMNWPSGTFLLTPGELGMMTSLLKSLAKRRAEEPNRNRASANRTVFIL